MEKVWVSRESRWKHHKYFPLSNYSLLLLFKPPSIHPSFSDVKSWGAILFSYWSHGTCTSLFWHMFIFCFWKLCGFTLIFSLSPACCAVICYINDVQTTEWLWLTRKVSDFINAVSGYVYITSPMIYVEMSFDVVQINKTGSPGFV